MTASVTPRLVSRAEAAMYCGLKPSRFSDLVRSGKMPSAVPGTTKWDMKAIDLHLDKIAGIKSEEPKTALELWREKKNARSA